MYSQKEFKRVSKRYQKYKKEKSNDPYKDQVERYRKITNLNTKICAQKGKNIF